MTNTILPFAAPIWSITVANYINTFMLFIFTFNFDIYTYLKLY